jgi:hypothetical protein
MFVLFMFMCYVIRILVLIVAHFGVTLIANSLLISKAKNLDRPNSDPEYYKKSKRRTRSDIFAL